ncbi:MAG: 4-hydroxy-2-oxovalerate aldolase [Rhodospirillaceae bacterium]|nr:4-hydroxy-2-oxovalerate aldolase [Rhodospirillaceae bacterium]
MFRDNRLKRKLSAGETAHGCWVFLEGGDGVEILSLVGFDALIVDHEHIGADFKTLIAQMRAAQATDTTMLLRVPSDDPVYISRALDAGIEGIIVPTVETAEQLRQIIATCQYRPHGGKRGVGYPESRAADWSMAELDYPKLYRDRLAIGVLIETRKGVENIDEILAVEGLDFVMIGTGDLAADLVDDFEDLAAYGSYDNAELDRLVATLEEKVNASPVALAGVVRSPEKAKALAARGYDFVTLTADIWLLIDGARRALEAAR